MNKDVNLKKILIFSADTDFCRSLTFLFQSKYHVTSTTILEELEVLIRKERIDLLLADSNKSDERVYIFIQNLKDIYINLLIVLLDVRKSFGLKTEENIRTYVDEILLKPVNANQMLDVIDELFASNPNK
jgi:DNA-binding NtrC family response regulator